MAIFSGLMWGWLVWGREIWSGGIAGWRGVGVRITRGNGGRSRARRRFCLQFFEQHVEARVVGLERLSQMTQPTFEWIESFFGETAVAFGALGTATNDAGFFEDSYVA
jgi:hypothetical protein